MKKKSNLFEITAALMFCLVSVFAFSSCSDDDDAAPISVKQMYGKTLTTRNYSFRWNGEVSQQRDDVTATFDQISGDTTKLRMTIKGIIPSADDDVVLTVNVNPTSSAINYSGQTDNPNYTMNVEGQFFPSGESDFFSLYITYESAGIPTAQAYTFNFASGGLAIENGVTGNVEINGTTYDKTTLATNVITHINGKLASEVGSMRALFNTDGTLSLSLANADGTDYTAWLTGNYWFTDNSNEVILELSAANAATFCQTLLGASDASLFTAYEGDTDRCIVKMRFSTTGGLTLGFTAPYLQAAISQYAAGSWMTGATTADRTNAAAFAEYLTNGGEASSWTIAVGSAN